MVAYMSLKWGRVETLRHEHHTEQLCLLPFLSFWCGLARTGNNMECTFGHQPRRVTSQSRLRLYLTVLLLHSAAHWQDDAILIKVPAPLSTEPGSLSVSLMDTGTARFVQCLCLQYYQYWADWLNSTLLSAIIWTSLQVLVNHRQRPAFPGVSSAYQLSESSLLMISNQRLSVLPTW